MRLTDFFIRDGWTSIRKKKLSMKYGRYLYVLNNQKIYLINVENWYTIIKNTKYTTQ
jgi:hypothetical protein